ncbi:hypothetical protein E4U42_004604 [Claviceps africana]|uniref:Peptidase A1 domain-containing protein n=1 Tax=Claviceps africana TaxID=83212 RepID=A0A8K0J7S9_9HYPO|nr:hypothetical protein E4U42_004604 [Claviceps africana]
MISAVILQLAFCISSASAFYPYTPPWLKEKEGITLLAEAKRNAAPNSATGDGVAFTIEQRASEVSDSRMGRLRRSLLLSKNIRTHLSRVKAHALPANCQSQNDESPAQRAFRQAAWLRSKFSHTRSEIPEVGRGSIHQRSGNTYQVVDAATPTQPTTAGINQDGTDYSYFVKAQLGSKKKEFYLLLDTGAGSTWVMGSSCTDKACTMHKTFGATDSDTLADSKKPFSISYGSGTVQGSLATDTISVGGISLRYMLGLASKTSEDFTHFAFDGILGMSMSRGPSDNFLSAIAAGNKVEKNIFGVALNRAADGHNNGEIRFGATNPDKYQGDMTYTPVRSKTGDWSIEIDDMAYNGKKAGSGGVLAYIDTGTSFVFGPVDRVKKLHAVIPGSSSADGLTYTVPCHSSDDLTFTFSGVDYRLSTKDWISPKDGEGRCTSNIYGHEVVEGSWLLGDTFLKNVYTVFDRDEGRVGFAAAAGSQDSSNAPKSPGRDGSDKKTGHDSKAGPGTALTTNAEPQSTGSAQANGYPLGLSGHETVAFGATGVAMATGKPSESSKSAAANVQASQYAKLAAAMFSMTVLALAA